jgi:hypothetical protein
MTTLGRLQDACAGLTLEQLTASHCSGIDYNTKQRGTRMKFQVET